MGSHDRRRGAVVVDAYLLWGVVLSGDDARRLGLDVEDESTWRPRGLGEKFELSPYGTDESPVWVLEPVDRPRFGASGSCPVRVTLDLVAELHQVAQAVWTTCDGDAVRRELDLSTEPRLWLVADELG